MLLIRKIITNNCNVKLHFCKADGGRMNWDLFKVFLAVARYGSLSKAASELSVNHSTIFRRLNAFEEDINGKLFERTQNRYELTTLGLELLAHAQKIENSFNDIERHIVGRDIQPKGTVKITAPNNIAYRYLPQFIVNFNKMYPDIKIELLVSNQEFNMSNRQADIAVRATGSPPEHLIGRKVATIQWSFFASELYKKNYGSPKNIDELKRHRMIGATSMLSHLPAFVWLEKQFADQIITRSDDLTAMSYFAENGQGVACLPEDQARPELVRLFSVDNSKPSHLWLLTHPDLRNVTRIKLVMRHLAEAFTTHRSFANRDFKQT